MNDYRAKGGLTRMKNMTPEQRSDLAKKAIEERFHPTIPRATHSGVLQIGDKKIDCAVLKMPDGSVKRILSSRSIMKTMGRGKANNEEVKNARAIGLPVFLYAKNLRPFFPQGNSMAGCPIIYKNKNNRSVEGYEYQILTLACETYLKARDAGVLTKDQVDLAKSCEILMRSFAQVGLVALIDETAGYFEEKKKEEYRNIFRDYIREEQRKWEKEFPDQFFDMLYKIYDLKKTKGNPSFFGHVIRKYIYHPLANSNGAILAELESKNPVVYANGKRKYRLFQFLSEKVGMVALKNHLWQIIGIGNSVDTKEQFEASFKKAFPIKTMENIGEPKSIDNQT